MKSSLNIRHELIGRLNAGVCSERNTKRAGEQLVMLEKHLTNVGWPTEVPVKLLSEAFLPPEQVFPQMIPVGKLIGFRICSSVPAFVAKHGQWAIEFYTRNTAASGAVFSYITCSYFDSAEEFLETLRNGPAKENQETSSPVVENTSVTTVSQSRVEEDSLPKFPSISDFQNDDSAMKQFMRLVIDDPKTSENGVILTGDVGIVGALVALDSKVMSSLFMTIIRDWVHYEPREKVYIACIYARLKYLGLIVKMQAPHFEMLGMPIPKKGILWILVDPGQAVTRSNSPQKQAQVNIEEDQGEGEAKVIAGRKVEVRFETPPPSRSLSQVLRPPTSPGEVSAPNGHSALLSLDVSKELTALVDLQHQLKVTDSELAAAQAQVKALEERRKYLHSTITGPRFSQLKEVYTALQSAFQT